MAGPRATIDFFAAQAAARRRTAVLVVWFALAWLGTIALVWLGLGLVAEILARGAHRVVFGPGPLAATALAVSAVTLAGCAWHAARLRADGGDGVARLLGGVPVSRTTADPAERRLVNVVEEMAIASGLPVPALYLLPAEPGINAFAAGLTPDRGVVVVTRGAVDGLTRDELQGVVAHEFSHLLNGDARLNLRLVALVGGITILALAGRFLVSEVGVGRSRWRGGGRARLFALALGACLWVAGSVGAFFGRLIRAAVSRQREFLADAAAVQFTRNPEGLASALARIARQGSAISSAAGPELSHLFFASGLSSQWLATHPPVVERIRRLAPHGLARALHRAAAEVSGPAAPDAAGLPAGAAALSAAAPGLGEAGPTLAATALAASAGHPEPRHVAWAAGLLARLPPDVAAAARDPVRAGSLVRALLADADAGRRAVQLARLGRGAGDATGEVAALAAALATSGRQDRIAVLDLALPTLDGLPAAAAGALVEDLAALDAADGRTSVFEWAVQRIVHRRLAPARGAGDPGGRVRTVGDVEVEALEVLSAIAWLGAPDERAAQAALDAAVAVLGVSGRWRPLPRDRVRAATLDAALARLDAAPPALKSRLVGACAAAALADGLVVAAEGEVVRAVAASLGCPVPPLAPADPAPPASPAVRSA